jgi:hypothetical protein
MGSRKKMWLVRQRLHKHVTIMDYLGRYYSSGRVHGRLIISWAKLLRVDAEMIKRKIEDSESW